MDKLTSYLLKLYEQRIPVPATPKPLMTYSPQVDVAKIKSKANLDKAKCFQLKCQAATTQYDTMFCKYGCIKDLAFEALQSIKGLATNCAQAKNPNHCREYINSVAITIQKKIEVATQMQEKAQELTTRARVNKQGGIGAEKNGKPPIG
jgi:hypothetical protein